MALELGPHTVPDHLAQSVASKVTLTSAFAGVYGWAADINWIGLSAVLFSIIGLLANLYFLHRRDSREAKESEIRIATLKARLDDDSE